MVAPSMDMGVVAESTTTLLGTAAGPVRGGEAVALRRAATGQREVGDDAFSQAVAVHHRELARFAFRLCGDPVVAEDVVAESYAKVWPHWRRGRVDVLMPYLMRTVANEAFALHRRRRLERRKEPAPPESHPSTSFEDRVEEHDELWAALDLLNPEQRAVLVLRVVEDMSEEQTATMLGIPPGTVKSRLSRALRTLRSAVEGSHV
jgi:RNA polymerase sigma-70 factor (sigma-E family)